MKNTHRIAEVLNDNGSVGFITRGDANNVDDTYTVYAGDIIGQWKGAKIGGFGKVMDFLRTKRDFSFAYFCP